MAACDAWKTMAGNRDALDRFLRCCLQRMVLFPAK
jgi:hypothetical protein